MWTIIAGPVVRLRLAVEDLAAASADPTPAPEALSRLGVSLTAIFGSLSPEDRFLLSAWFLDQRTLVEISRVLRVHEATVSRAIKRLTAKLHKELLEHLQASGMSKAAAEEALGADPRDLDINLRSLLQASQPLRVPRTGSIRGPAKSMIERLHPGPIPTRIRSTPS